PDAGAGVGDVDPEVLAGRAGRTLTDARADPDRALLHELEGGGDDVEERLGQAVGVDPHGREPRLELRDEVDVLVADELAAALARLVEDLYRRRPLALHVEPPGVELGRVEDVVDQAQEVLA